MRGYASNRRTATPAASRPRRRLAASRPAPGVSPWTQMVSATIGTGEPSMPMTTPSVTMRRARSTTRDGSVMTDCPASRRQLAIALIGAVGESLGRDAEAFRAAGVEQRRPGQAEENQRPIERTDCARYRRSEPGIRRGHVVEGAVRLHVLQAHAFALRNPGHRRNLIQDEIFCVGR